MYVLGKYLAMIRGDSETINVSRVDSNGSAVPFVAGDTVYFTVKTDVNTTAKILQKKIEAFTDGVAVIAIVPADTKNLSYGDYVYDVQLTRADGSVSTIIPPNTFTIKGEVTFD
jgi:hypothetical protein